LLRYLGRHRQALNAAIRDTLGYDTVEWLDVPFDRSRPWKDAEWIGLDFLPADSSTRVAWRDFWPRRSNPPNWDAIGQVTTQGRTEWLLAEAKVHLGEIQSSCGAKAAGGRSLIARALAETKAALGVPAKRDWLTG